MHVLDVLNGRVTPDKDRDKLPSFLSENGPKAISGSYEENIRQVLALCEVFRAFSQLL